MRGAKVNRVRDWCTETRASRRNTRATAVTRAPAPEPAAAAPCRAATIRANRAGRVAAVTPHPPLTTLHPSLIRIHPSIDRRDLLHPPSALRVLHGHDLPLRPVEVIGD